MAFLYSNENFPRRVVEALRVLGHDVLTSFESGKANQRIPDVEVLIYATKLGRALITLNRRDFIHLHNASPSHAEVIVCTVDANSQALAQRLHQALAKETELAGRLIRVVKGGFS